MTEKETQYLSSSFHHLEAIKMYLQYAMEVFLFIYIDVCAFVFTRVELFDQWGHSVGDGVSCYQ